LTIMTDDDFTRYLRGLGFTVEATQDGNGQAYTVIRKVRLTTGSLAGKSCDIALARCMSTPYIVAPAIHTRPALVPMDMQGPLRTQQSPLGPEWQYWSRRFDHSPTPQQVWAHILTILGEV
jgi:hypothetical protein